ILTGTRSLAYGELAGEPIRPGLLRHDPEEEQHCFSDNTPWSHYYDAVGIDNVHPGRSRRGNRRLVSGPGLEHYLRAYHPELHAQMNARMEESALSMQVLVEKGEAGETFDVLIAQGNSEGEAIINRIVSALMEATRSIENVINALQLQNVSIEGSSSLPPNA